MGREEDSRCNQKLGNVLCQSPPPSWLSPAKRLHPRYALNFQGAHIGRVSINSAKLKTQLGRNAVKSVLAVSRAAVPPPSLLGHRRVPHAVAACTVAIAQRPCRLPRGVCPNCSSLAVGCSVPTVVHNLHRQSLDHLPVFQMSRVWVLHHKRHPVVSN